MFLLRDDFADFASIPCIDSVLDQLLHAENEIKLKNWLNTDNFISISFLFFEIYVDSRIYHMDCPYYAAAQQGKIKCWKILSCK